MDVSSCEAPLVGMTSDQAAESGARERSWKLLFLDIQD